MLRSRPSYMYISPDNAGTSSSPADEAELPPMSPDGGSAAEFEEYLACNAACQRLEGGWVERRAHPQVNVQPYWYNEESGDLVWTQPDARELAAPPSRRSLFPLGGGELAGAGLEWDTAPLILRSNLEAAGSARGAGLSVEELARRAVALFEAFEPWVLSWHDFQPITFWFRHDNVAYNIDSRDRSAFCLEKDFLYLAAEVLIARVHRMHPICLTHFLATFLIAGVIDRDLMQAAGDSLCKGRLPMMDRRSIGVMLRIFSDGGVRHDRFFEAAAAELSRPSRLRSLEPRDFRNVLGAYGRNRHWNKSLFDCLSRGMIRLLNYELVDSADATLHREALFPSKGKAGFEQQPKAFYTSELTSILKVFQSMAIDGPEAGRCIVTMVRYVLRTLSEPPNYRLREPGCACAFVFTLTEMNQELPEPWLWHKIGNLYWDICHRADSRLSKQLRSALEQRGLKIGLKRYAFQPFGLPPSYLGRQ